MTPQDTLEEVREETPLRRLVVLFEAKKRINPTEGLLIDFRMLEQKPLPVERAGT